MGQQAGGVGVVDATGGQDLGRGQGGHGNTRHGGTRQGDGALQVARAAGLQVSRHAGWRFERSHVGCGHSGGHPDQAAGGTCRMGIELRPCHAAQACLHAGMRRVYPHQRSARQRALQLPGIRRIQHRRARERVVDVRKAQARLGGQALHHRRARGRGDIGGEPQQHGRSLIGAIGCASRDGMHLRRSQQQAPQCRAQDERVHGWAGGPPAASGADTARVSGM